MKKTIVFLSLIIAGISASAQSAPEPLLDRSLVFDIINICGVLLVVYLISNFILQMTKRNLDYRLKNKIIDKETPENIATQILQQTDKKEDRNFILQWIFVLAGIGTGVTITNFTRPVGLHSVAIIAFCVAAGFTCYYLVTRRTQK
jgi:hypothetical protein